MSTQTSEIYNEEERKGPQPHGAYILKDTKEEKKNRMFSDGRQ